MTADRQYGEAAIDQELTTLGVERVAIRARAGRAVPARPTSTLVDSDGW